MTWRVPRHVFQARAPSRNSTKHRADNFCGNLICEHFCWMLGDPHFFFDRSLPFLILSILLKKKKQKNLYVESFNYFSYTLQIGSNWYMDTGVYRCLEIWRSSDFVRSYESINVFVFSSFYCNMICFASFKRLAVKSLRSR